MCRRKREWQQRGIARDHLCSYNLEYFIIPFRNKLFPTLPAERLHLVLYFSTEYHNSRQKIRICFGNTVLVDIRSEAWLILFWKYHTKIENCLGYTKKKWLSWNISKMWNCYSSTLLGPVNFASPEMSSTWERSRFLNQQFRSWREHEKTKRLYESFDFSSYIKKPKSWDDLWFFSIMEILVLKLFRSSSGFIIAISWFISVHANPN